MKELKKWMTKLKIWRAIWGINWRSGKKSRTKLMSLKEKFDERKKK